MRIIINIFIILSFNNIYLIRKPKIGIYLFSILIVIYLIIKNIFVLESSLRFFIRTKLLMRNYFKIIKNVKYFSSYSFLIFLLAQGFLNNFKGVIISRVICRGIIRRIGEEIYLLLIFRVYSLILNLVAIKLLISLFS